MSSRPWRVRAVAAGATIAATALLAARGSSGGAAKTSGASGVLTVTTGSAGVFADNFNQFSPNAEDPTNGMIYEPLFFFDTAKSGVVKPWLGTSYAWSNGGKTVTVRSGTT